MKRRKILGIVLLILCALVFFFTLSMLVGNDFKAYKLLYSLSFATLLIHWYFLWILMRFEKQSNHLLNVIGQIFNFGVGVTSSIILVSSDLIDVYWNWILSFGFLGGGITLIFLTGASENKFRILPWVNSFLITLWVLFSVYIFIEKADSALLFDIMIWGWLTVMLFSTFSILTKPKT